MILGIEVSARHSAHDLCLDSSAHYLNDTWIFDTQEYKWGQIDFKESERKPSYVPSQIRT
jgi:hypothetical protein